MELWDDLNICMSIAAKHNRVLLNAYIDTRIVPDPTWRIADGYLKKNSVVKSINPEKVKFEDVTLFSICLVTNYSEHS